MHRNPKVVSLDPLLQAAVGLLPNAARAEDMVAALADVPKFLAELGVAHPEELYEHEIGSGAFARAFELPDGRVLKLTTDSDDAEAAEIARRGGPRPGLPHVDDVRRMPGMVVERVIRHDDVDELGFGQLRDEPRPLFAIVVEHVVPEKRLDTMAPEIAGELRKARWGLVEAAVHRHSDSFEHMLRTVMRRVDDFSGGADAMQFAHDLTSGWWWLDQHGYHLRDLHEQNVGLAEGDRAVILDLGASSMVSEEDRPQIPLAANPGSKVDRIFDEAFDVVAERFPDFGEVELHEDERAGADNGAGSDRQYGYCMDGDPIVIAFAAKAEKLPLNRLRGLMRHEFGHALEYRFGVKELEKRLKKKLPPKVERRADAIAEAVWGEPIEYDGRDVQCVGHGTGRRRPKYLPDERDVLRPNTGKLVGYKAMRYENGRAVSSADSRQGFDVERGRMITMPGRGVFVSTNRDYILQYYAGHNPREVLLTLEFDPSDIVSGEETLRDREPELTVRSAKIVDFEVMEHDDLEANTVGDVDIRQVETGGKHEFRFDALRHGKTVGFIIATRRRGRLAGRVVYTVSTVYVEEPYRRLRVATRLYEAAAREACRRRSRLASTERHRDSYSNDFWRKQVNEGRATRVGSDAYILGCEEADGSLVANVTGDTVVLPKGSPLFHGTLEEFEGALRPGGYDQVLWFADVPSIAQLYIPCSGGSAYMTPEGLKRPSQHAATQALQRQTGIIYDYESGVEWDEYGRLRSYASPRGFEGRIPTDAEVVEMLRDAGFGMLRPWESFSVDTYIDDEGRYHVLPPGTCRTGRLFVARPRRDMKIYVMAHEEGDLMSPQYHAVKAFAALAERGYDGVLINDFAQSKEWGNLGHFSVGIFPHAVGDLEATSVPAEYREFEDRRWGTVDYPYDGEPYFGDLGGVRRRYEGA